MILILVSYWGGILMVAGAVTVGGNTVAGMVIVGLGAIVQSVALMLYKL